jgi:hypothetical protein
MLNSEATIDNRDRIVFMGFGPPPPMYPSLLARRSGPPSSKITPSSAKGSGSTVRLAMGWEGMGSREVDGDEGNKVELGVSLDGQGYRDLIEVLACMSLKRSLIARFKGDRVRLYYDFWSPHNLLTVPFFKAGFFQVIVTVAPPASDVTHTIQPQMTCLEASLARELGWIKVFVRARRLN